MLTQWRFFIYNWAYCFFHSHDMCLQTNRKKSIFTISIKFVQFVNVQLISACIIWMWYGFIPSLYRDFCKHLSGKSWFPMKISQLTFFGPNISWKPMIDVFLLSFTRHYLPKFIINSTDFSTISENDFTIYCWWHGNFLPNCFQIAIFCL